MPEENVEVARRAWEAWQNQDWAAMHENWDPAIVWDMTHFREWPDKRYEGHEGFDQFLTEWLEVWDELEVGVDDILDAPGDRVLILAWQRGLGRSSGLPMSMEWGQIATIRDGKITRLDNYDDRSEALEAAGLSE